MRVILLSLLCFPLLPVAAQELLDKSFIEQAREAAQKGDNDTAIRLYEQALNSALKVFKEDDIEVVMRRAELGEAYRAVGRWDDAIPQLDYVWKRTRFDAENKQRWLKEEGNLAQTSAEKLGRALQGAARYTEAVKVFTTAIADAERQQRDDAEIINFDALLADTLLLLSREEEAGAVIQHALQRIERRHGDSAATRARLLTAFGTLCYHHRRFAQCAELAQKALDLELKSGNVESGTLARYQDNLGAALVQLGRVDEAEKLLLQAKEGFLKQFTPDAPELMHVHLHLAEVAAKRGQLEKATELTTEALRICRLHYPEANPETGKCLHNLAALWLRQGSPGKAGDLAIKALLVFQTTMGKDHPQTRETAALLEKIREVLPKDGP